MGTYCWCGDGHCEFDVLYDDLCIPSKSNDTDYSSPSKGEPIGESKTSKDLDDDFEQLSVSDAKKGDDDHVSPAKETFNDNTRGAGDKDSYYDEK